MGETMLSTAAQARKTRVGQEVAIVSRTAMSVGWVVRRVTPKGQVVVVRKGGVERRFDESGCQIGRGIGEPRLDFDVDGVRRKLAVLQSQRAVALAMTQIEAAVQKHRFGDLDQMELGLDLVGERLAAARAALVAARRAEMERVDLVRGRRRA
jgi:hypothetical protein